MACKRDNPRAHAPPLQFKLERVATNTGENAILFDYPEGAGYYVRISGKDLKASVPLGSLQKVQKRIVLQTENVGSYSVEVVIALADQTEIIRDVLHWDYTRSTPAAPIVSLSEAASNDAHVFILVSSSHLPNLKEIWVGGDVESEQWLPIPASRMVPIRLSAADGKKRVLTKLRDNAGNESLPTELSLLRKNIGPQNCTGRLISSMGSGNRVRLQLSATNQGPLAFRVMGDVESIPSFQSFDGKHEVDIALSPGEGEKKLTLYIRDEAENYCPQIPLSVRIDSSYRSQAVTIDALWTDEPVVTLRMRQDSFNDQKVEIYVEGNVEAGPHTYKWLPFAPELRVELTPIDGHRIVKVLFRVNGDAKEQEHASIFLRPYVKLSGAGPVRQLLLSRIVGMKKVTVTGCRETYSKLDYSEGLPCTVGTEPVEARYILPDGSEVTRSIMP